RLDAQTSDRWQLPLPNLVHLDIDGDVIGRIFPVKAGMAADARTGLDALADDLGRGPATADEGWGAAAARGVRDAIVASLAPDRAPLFGFMRDLRAAFPRETITTHDAA